MPIAFWFFIFSFLSLAIMVGLRTFELSGGHKILEANFVRKTDIIVHDFFHLLKKQISRISIRNIYTFFCFICTKVKIATINFKRGYDSRQPKFFIKQTKNDINKAGSVSFFLKNVSDYKDSIRKK